MSLNNAVESDVKKFIADFLGAKLEGLSANVSLFHDLGVDGDDAQEFLSEFSRRFSVSIEQFPIQDYFGLEQTVTLPAIFNQIFNRMERKKFKRLEVKDLVVAAATGVLSPR